jgi:uncharacterized protein YbjT (DUF2867 family)
MKIKAIITGATGMVGEGVLHECLQHPDIESVLVINRRPCNVSHPKLTEIIHENFTDLSAIEHQLGGYNACFFCLGVSSVGMKEDKYTKFTYDLTMGFAGTLAGLNPEMTFCYVSGAGTDSSEKGKMMWARVKGKTENDLMKLPFKKAYMFRPAFIEPTKGLKNSYRAYKFLSPLIPVIRVLLPKHICKLSEIGIAMINSVNLGFDKQVLEVKDIKELAGR